MFDDLEIEVTKEFKYLGIYFTRGCAFDINEAKKHIVEQANKAIYSLLKKIRTFNLPLDMQLEPFDKTIKPILLYWCGSMGVLKLRYYRAGTFEIFEIRIKS